MFAKNTTRCSQNQTALETNSVCETLDDIRGGRPAGVGRAHGTASVTDGPQARGQRKQTAPRSPTVGAAGPKKTDDPRRGRGREQMGPSHAAGRTVRPLGRTARQAPGDRTPRRLDSTQHALERSPWDVAVAQSGAHPKDSDVRSHGNLHANVHSCRVHDRPKLGTTRRPSAADGEAASLRRRSVPPPKGGAPARATA